MKSKPGAVEICLFLVSIFFCLSLFAQYPAARGTHFRTISTATEAISVSGTSSLVFTSTPFTGNVANTQCSLPISDTTIKKDKDNDGIVDSLDKCPDEKGVIQYDGCPVPDSDNDGVVDDSDNCPTVAGVAKYKGCPIPDTDGDKINDEEDKCPAQPGVARYGGCPVGDRDSDGVNDDDDKCIDMKGTISNAGCPDNKRNASLSGKEKTKKKKAGKA